MFDINLGLSEVANIIFPLLLLFQWYKDRSREEAIRNTLVGIRDMVHRADTPSSPDILTAIDSGLATLGVRRPFVERGKQIIYSALLKFRRIENSPVNKPQSIDIRELEVRK